MELSDLMNMLKNPQAIQAKAEELRRKTATIRATGQAGGGMVKIILSGEMELLECVIAPEVIDPAEPSFLGDLVRAAHNDAAAKVQDAIRQQLSDEMGGMGALPGFGGVSPFGGGASFGAC
ncbi:MAG: YbaB/EbfC family nucleoid-associated protein [Spirochaetes bacterium]|nr:YbaB/EbfC family nucleoid-associated protein [Spirochaetota bacterium]